MNIAPERYDNMKRTTHLIGCMVICISLIVGCSHQSNSSANSSSSIMSLTEEVSASDYYATNVEATFTLASYVRSEAAFYKWDSNTPNVIYGIIQDDKGYPTKDHIAAVKKYGVYNHFFRQTSRYCIFTSTAGEMRINRRIRNYKKY